MTDADQLATRSAADPHAFLGAHPDGKRGVVVRAFRPAARAVRVLTADGCRAEQRPVHPGGVFEGKLDEGQGRSTTSSRSTTARTAPTPWVTLTASYRRSGT